MSVPARPFRGRDQQEEGQVNPVYKALAGRLDSNNLATAAVVPLMTSAGSGTEVVVAGGNIAWDIRNLTFASSTGNNAVSFTHALSRVPHAYINVLYNPLQVPIAPASTAQWNSTQVIFAIPADTVTNSFRFLLM